MKAFFYIISIAFVLPVYAQEIKPSLVDTITSHKTTMLQWLNTLSWQDVKMGFAKRSPRCHCRYAFDSAFTYKEYDFDCTAEFVTNQGTWKIGNKNKLVMNSKSGTEVFRLAKVSNCIFLIPVGKVGQFTKDLKLALSKIKKHDSAKVVSLSLMLRLIKKYFCRADL